ncbi:helix-turn-helix domain-containing protein [Aureispira anguillae]|uniref:Helix-turn-helix domain-containing protein n=1 Tax=Aureispira anguillae TaxID=2864201 RepID=A0A915YLH9_9BACT|nr:helix-turn-helix domain-containing protein [Aureispira anguillae]BDS15323.1 helix-turn-helix domain-containing protein [Aureispira anguillae]
MRIKPAKSIAVLPFVNMSSNKENEYFSDGMTEEIINALAKIKRLKVTSRTSSFFFKNKNIPIPQIGQQLNVSTILEGSVRLSGNKMRITAQLIDVSDDFHFWSDTFDRSIDDIFAVQDEISLLIADKLREHIGHFEIEDHLVDQLDIPIETYQLYLKGRFHLMKLNLPGTLKGIDILKEVIAAQPNFPLAYLGINQGYTFIGTMGLIPAHEAFAKARPFLEKAIELDENLPESQLNLSWICCWQKWDLEAAYRHINKALNIRPADHIYLTMASVLSVEGKFEAAFNYIDKALQLDPFSAINHHFKGFIFYLQEKFEQAIPHFEKSLQLQADLTILQAEWGRSLLLMGRLSEGLAFYQNLPDDNSGSLTKLEGLTLAYAALGDLEQAALGIKELEAALETAAMGNALISLILCKTMLDKKEEAIQLMEQGLKLRLPMLLLLYTEPLLKPLRSMPRFQALMQEILGKKTSFGLSKRKYKKSLFNKTSLAQYQQQLEKLMQEKQPYLDPDLTLRSLAQMLNIPPNQLSQLLNEGFDKNFAAYVNSYRIESFKSKAANPNLRHLTILALAYESGFNSKTVFNTFFKKKMGITPKAYWKTLTQ